VPETETAAVVENTDRDVILGDIDENATRYILFLTDLRNLGARNRATNCRRCSSCSGQESIYRCDHGGIAGGGGYRNPTL